MKRPEPRWPAGRTSTQWAIVLAGLLAAFATPLVASAAASGPIVAVRDFVGPAAQPDLGRGFKDMLITDLVRNQEPCTLTVATWGKDREAVRGEIKVQQNPAFDPSTRAATGKLAQPDVFVDGSISIAGGRFSWSVRITDAMTGEVQANLQGSAAGDDLVGGEEAFARKLAAELCRARPGYVLSGRMDEATIKGFVCGDLAKPFTARSPEVAATWTFTPTSKTSGSFVYSAANVGGVPGKGSGTYKIVPGAAGTRRIQLSGSGSIISPVGSFSAPITESLTLTPAASCNRTGDR